MKEREKEKEDKARERYLQKTYGISNLEYNQLLEFQNGKCAFCKKVVQGRKLAVEHDHKTGAIRALACFRCNKFKIASYTLEEAKALVEYLENTPADQFFKEKRIVPIQEKKKGKRRRRKP